MRRCCLILLCCALATGGQWARGGEEDDWINLFNGKDLTGWRVNENSKSFRVEDGMIIVSGPRAHAFYVGEDGKASFRNFHLQARVMTFPTDSSKARASPTSIRVIATTDPIIIARPIAC